MYQNAIQHSLIWSLNPVHFPVTVPIHSHIASNTVLAVSHIHDTQVYLQCVNIGQWSSLCF